MNTITHQAALDAFPDRLRESERFHMASGNVHQTLKKLARDLDEAGIDYAIVGAMALNAHGYQRETVDVDVLIRPEGLQDFRERYEGRGYRPAFAGARKTFLNAETGTKVEFLTSGEYPGDGKPKPVAFPDPKEVSQLVGGTRVVNLPTLINLKLASGMTQPSRRRDLSDVQDLARIIGLDESFGEQLHPFVREMYLTLIRELRQLDPHAE
jgi:hypothetical protein